ncbi:hypothetical protein WH47_08624 [Habropoda laboriosa]|uniref:Uncharacterized protein n=2 Tax=Habropoda laboriosa TaxID=597456 RepID=A0A0L7QP55_9HYME|nr:hypothetical protein WH47_08624 [Habropoda laboriosa]
MAASRVDLNIDEDRTTVNESSIHCESPVSEDSSVTGDVDKQRKTDKEDSLEPRAVISEDDRMGRLIVTEDPCKRSSKNVYGSNSTVHDGRKKSLLGQDKTTKNWRKRELADQSKSLDSEITDRKTRLDDAYDLSPGQKRLNVDFRVDNSIQIKEQKNSELSKKLENNQAPISTRVIHKLMGSGKQRNSNSGKKDQREVSPRHGPRNHANLIVDTTEGSVEGSASSRTESPRKLADSPGDCAARSTVKRREDVAESKKTRSSTSQESPPVSEPRSSSDATPVRKPRKHVASGKCESCGEPNLSYERTYLHKYSGNLDCEGLVYEENHANGRESRQETPVASLLYHSRSLPRLSVHDSGVACSGNEQTAVAGHPHNTRQLVADLKQLHTLKQHYYPEGGWGWVVVFVGVLVQMLSHGMHESSGVFLHQVADKFGFHMYFETG